MNRQSMKRNILTMSTRLLGASATDALRTLYRHWKGFRPSDIGSSQSNEADLIDRLLQNVTVSRTFCEFGFDIFELNCGRLALRGWQGLLIDGHEQRVRVAQRVLAPARHLNVSAVHAFLDKTNLRSIVGTHFDNTDLGVLSIDVDGNDYWFLQELISLEPHLVVVEYNASLGLRPITVPYDAVFERHNKHPSGWYHGASITALHSLCARHGYSLIAVSDSGLNLFFLRDALLPRHLVRLEPAQTYRENVLRNGWSHTKAEQQWDLIRHLPFVTV